MQQLDVLECAGRALHPVEDRIRKYCGLPWSGGPPETWAFAYFDRIPSDPDRIGPVDVVSCAALHPGLSQTDLEWFAQSAHDLEGRLARLPIDVDLADAPCEIVSAVEELVHFVDPVEMSLISKVAHRKRPRLVPLLDRSIADRYWNRTRKRGAQAWSSLVREIRMDLQSTPNRRVLNDVQVALRPELGAATPSALRILDIAVWMEAVQ